MAEPLFHMRENGHYIPPRQKAKNAIAVGASAVALASPFIASVLYANHVAKEAVVESSNETYVSAEDCDFGKILHRSEIPFADAALVVKERLDNVTEKPLGYLCVSVSSSPDVTTERYLGILIEEDGKTYGFDESDVYTEYAGWIALYPGNEYDITGTAQSLNTMNYGEMFSRSLSLRYDVTTDTFGSINETQVEILDPSIG